MEAALIGDLPSGDKRHEAVRQAYKRSLAAALGHKRPICDGRFSPLKRTRQRSARSFWCLNIRRTGLVG
jgi:hypothetical protein